MSNVSYLYMVEGNGWQELLQLAITLLLLFKIFKIICFLNTEIMVNITPEVFQLLQQFRFSEQSLA